MTWLRKPLLICILMGAAAALCLVGPARADGIWSEYAFISSTLGVSDSRICIGEGSRGDIGCPSFAPTISPTGRLNASAGLTVDTVSLTTGGTTWGYLGSGSSYLPNLNTSNISVSTINGVSASSFGGGASPTNVPGFVAHRNSIAQTSVPVDTWAKVNLTHESYDNYNSFNTANGRFQPNVAGNYIITAGVACSPAGSCYAGIFKNGVDIYTSGHSQSPAGQIFATTSGIVQLNGTTDYVELWGYTDGTSFVGMPASTYFSGSLLASGNGLISGTGVTALSALTDVALSSPATGQVLTYNGTNWVNTTPSATTVISGTTTMVEGWPDALICTIGGTNYTFYQNRAAVSGGAMYKYENGSTIWQVSFANSASTGDTSGSSTAVSNCSKSVSQLYAEGRAFNFIGNSGAGSGALGDRIVSGSTSVLASPSGTIAVSGSLNVSGAVVGESFTVSTTVNMRNNPSATCISGTLGAVTQINSKLYFCRM